ncbi:MAG: hypothetical protein ACFFCV_05035 [Promethearchaeota archaeon]
MNNKNWRQIAFIIAMVNCIQSLIFTSIAMFFYPGGTFSDTNSVGFLFFSNLFSDLGRTIAHSGASNLISSIVYNVSLFLMGVLLIPFFIAIPYLFGETGEGKGLAKASSALGIIVGAGMIGASLTPADLFYQIHVSFGYLSFITLLPLTILYFLAILQNKTYHNQYAYVYFVFGIIQVIFLFIMSFSASEQGILTIFAAGQSILVIAMTVSFFIQAYGAWKLQISKNL